MFEFVFDKASDCYLRVMRTALDECERFGNHWLCSEHLLLALTNDSEHLAGQALESMKVDAKSVQKEADKRLKEKNASEPLFCERPDSTSEPADKPKLRVFTGAEEGTASAAFSQPVVEALRRSHDYSLFFGQTEIHPEHLLLAVLDVEEAGANKILEELAANVTFLRRQIMALIARDALSEPSSLTLREAMVAGFNDIVARYQTHVHALTSLAKRAGGVSIQTPNRGQIVHLVCLSYMADFLFTQVSYQRYLLEKNIQSLSRRIGTLDKELSATLVSSGAQNLRSEVRSTIEYIWCNQYRLQTRLLDEAEHDLIGSVIEDLWWTQSEEIALNQAFSEALDDHRRNEILSLQKRRIELGHRVAKLRQRLEETVRQCFVKHSIPA
jgi:ATP-dependent Clp protease ATP-binding subunit ClpA